MTMRRRAATPAARRAAGRGTTLIELVAFIVILAVVVTGVMTGLAGALRVAGTPRDMNQALRLAENRMEVILAQRGRLGFTAFAASFDPCAAATPEACTAPTDFSVGAALAASYSSSDPNYRVVTVTVTKSGGQLAELKTIVANY